MYSPDYENGRQNYPTHGEQAYGINDASSSRDWREAPQQVYIAHELLSYVPQQALDAGQQAFDAGKQVFDAGKQVFDAGRQIISNPSQVLQVPGQVLKVGRSFFDSSQSNVDSRRGGSGAVAGVVGAGAVVGHELQETQGGSGFPVVDVPFNPSHMVAQSQIQSGAEAARLDAEGAGEVAESADGDCFGELLSGVFDCCCGNCC